jgi:hypothetical protein
VTGRPCSVCENAQVSAIDALLSSGTPTRQVARMYSLSRTTLARHREHLAPTSNPFAVIRGDAGPSGPPDPLSEAIALAERARTPRQRLRGLEQVRGATRLLLRGIEDPDESDRELLDHNVKAAEDAYSTSADFETQARALSGLREAITHRLDAQPKAQAIEVPIVVRLADGTPLGQNGTNRIDPSVYWRGVPKRFRHADRYVVQRTIALAWPPDTPHQDVIKVYEVATASVVWTS